MMTNSVSPEYMGAAVVCEKTLQRLQLHASRLNSPDVSWKVWNELLSQSDRDRLQTFEMEYANGRTVGIWARAKQVSGESAVVQLARKFGMPDGEYEYLLDQLGLTSDSTPNSKHALSWNRELGELSYHGTVIRKVSKPNQAKNIMAILDTFQEEGWPSRIDDPLTEGPDPERLGQTLQTLNKGLSMIRFERDGTGKGIRMRFLA